MPAAGAIGKKLLSNQKKVLSNRKKTAEQLKKNTEQLEKGTQQSEKVTDQSETTARAIGKGHRAIRNVKSKRKQLPEQSEKGTDQSENGPEQSETITDAVGYYWSSKRGRLICSISCSGSRLHRHDCWTCGARVLMFRLLRQTFPIFRLLCAFF